MARYTVLGAAFALLKYIETASNFTFPRGSVNLKFIDSNAGEFMTIDRRTAISLEVLANARNGDQKNCLFGKVDRTKVTLSKILSSLLSKQLLIQADFEIL